MSRCYKGANALRFGANSLGGAINFVTPTGRDASAVRRPARRRQLRLRARPGQHRRRARTVRLVRHRLGAARGRISRSQQRSIWNALNANFGYQLSPDAETRFYVNANSWRQRLPGELTKAAALNSPRAADPEFVRQDQQRNIDSVRLANKTTLRFGATTVDFGVFSHHRHVDHPIFRYLDYYVYDYGGFARATDDRMIGGFRNRLIAGVNIHNGTIDYEEYVNLTGAVKGALVAIHCGQIAELFGLCRELASSSVPNVALVAGRQFLHAVRDRQDRFLPNGDQSGRRTYDIFSPKVGVLWDVDPTWQVFGNISRSAEVPTFDANTFATPASSNVNAQTATTYEIGTRGRTAGHHVGRRALPRRDQERVAVPEDVAVQSLHRGERGPHRASGRRSSGSASRSSSRSSPRRTASGSTSPTPTTTSSSTATRATATTACPACRRTTSAPKCSTSIRAASTPARTSSGCRRPTSPTTPTA